MICCQENSVFVVPTLVVLSEQSFGMSCSKRIYPQTLGKDFLLEKADGEILKGLCTLPIGSLLCRIIAGGIYSWRMGPCFIVIKRAHGKVIQLHFRPLILQFG